MWNSNVFIGIFVTAENMKGFFVEEIVYILSLVHVMVKYTSNADFINSCIRLCNSTLARGR